MLNRSVVLTVLVVALAGCATAPPPTKSAPCKRPANLTPYAPIVPQDCGPVWPVNSAATAAELLAP